MYVYVCMYIYIYIAFCMYIYILRPSSSSRDILPYDHIASSKQNLRRETFLVFEIYFSHIYPHQEKELALVRCDFMEESISREEALRLLADLMFW